MVERRLPEVVPPSGRVPGRGLLVLPFSEARRRRNRGEIAKKGSVLEGFTLIRPKCTTILYSNSFLFIDIFHDRMLFLCCFGLFYTVCNFPMPKLPTQDSAVKSGR